MVLFAAKTNENARLVGKSGVFVLYYAPLSQFNCIYAQ